MFYLRTKIKNFLRLILRPVIRRVHEHIDHRISLVLLGKPSSEITSGQVSSTVSASQVNRTLAPKGITNEAQHVSQATSHSENNMILHSIYLLPSEFKGSSSDLPPRISANIASFKWSHPGFFHNLYGNDELVAFLEDKFGKEVSGAYQQLIPRAYKADLARYCLLYVYGGVYADLGAHFFRPIVEFQPNKLHIFRDSFGAAPWIVSNSIIAAPRKLPVFEEVIRNIVRNCNQKFYGETPLCPTGPNLFGRCLATHAKLEDIEVGETVKISKNPQTHSWAYIQQNGEILAVNVKIGAGLSSLGAPFSEDYGEIYKNKGVYR